MPDRAEISRQQHHTPRERDLNLFDYYYYCYCYYCCLLTTSFILLSTVSAFTFFLLPFWREFGGTALEWPSYLHHQSDRIKFRISWMNEWNGLVPLHPWKVWQSLWPQPPSPQTICQQSWSGQHCCGYLLWKQQKNLIKFHHVNQTVVMVSMHTTYPWLLPPWHRWHYRGWSSTAQGNASHTIPSPFRQKHQIHPSRHYQHTAHPVQKCLYDIFPRN